MKKEYSPFFVKTFSGTGDLEKVKEGICLISSSLLREDMGLDVRRTVILKDGELKKCFSDFRIVNKFQPAEAIYEQLLQCQMEREDIINAADFGLACKKIRVFGVYSPVKRIGKTTFAKQMCKDDGEKGRTLYLNLEEFSKEKEEGAGLSEVIYYYRQKKLGMIFSMPDIIRKEKDYDYILPVRWVFDLKEMSAKDWVLVIDGIEEAGIYDCIWIDFDDMPSGTELFEKCEKIYVPYTNEEDELRRIERFENMLKMMPEYDIDQKISKVLLKGGIGECI